MNPARKPAVILLSGGLDSATVLACAKRDGFDPYCLSFSYGQRHSVELEASKRVAQAGGALKHHIAHIDLAAFGGSSLVGDGEVPKDRDEATMSAKIPSTYVPARNTIFLSFALGWAEVLGAQDIYLGVNAVDYSGYPDCRPEYLEAFRALADLATRAGVEGGQKLSIHAPLELLSKADIIRLGLGLGVDYGLTHSCYDPDPTGKPCLACDSCKLRQAGFATVGTKDPQLERFGL